MRMLAIQQFLGRSSTATAFAGHLVHSLGRACQEIDPGASASKNLGFGGLVDERMQTVTDVAVRSHASTEGYEGLE